MPKITEDQLTLPFIPFLKEKEGILWAGKPVTGIKIRDADIILLPMSIILLGFSGMLDYILFQFDSPLVFKIIGITFGFTAVYVGILRIVLDAAKRSRIFYCITSKRILMLSGRKKKLQTLPLKNIDRLDFSEEKDGSGFIIFGSTNPLWPWLLGNFYMAGENIPGMQMLPDVKKVYKILQDEIRVQMPATLLEKISSETRDGLN